MIVGSSSIGHVRIEQVRELGVAVDQDRGTVAIVGSCLDDAKFILELGDVEVLRQLHETLGQAIGGMGGIVVAGADELARLGVKP